MYLCNNFEKKLFNGMKQKMKLLWLLLGAAAFITSCSKSVPKEIKYIPKDAFVVLGMDLKSLSEKSKAANINWDSLMKASIDDAADYQEGKKKWDELRTSGIDTAGRLYMFVKMGGSIMNGQSSSVGFVGGLNDVTKFEAYVNSQSPEGGIKKESNYSHARMHNMNIGWNSEVVIVSLVNMGYSENSESQSTASADQMLATIFAQKETDAVSSIPEFAELNEEKSDMIFWTNSTSATAAIPFIGVTKLADLLKDSYTASTINFENGKIEANCKSYSNKTLADILKKYAGPTVDMDMVNKYPAQADGFTTFSFKPELLVELIKFSGFDGMANQQLAEMGLTLDDLAKLFKGDFAIIFSDIHEEEKPNTYDPEIKMKEPTGSLVFDAKIGDKALYDKVAAKLYEKGLMEKNGNMYVPKNLSGEGNSWSVTDKDMVIATDSALLNQYLAGNAGKANIPSDIAALTKGKSVAFYLNINKILEAFSSAEPNSQTLTNAKQVFKDMYATVGNFDGKQTNSVFALRTMNDNENSLTTLIKFIIKESKEIKSAEQSMHGGMTDIDSTEVTPITPPAEKP